MCLSIFVLVIGIFASNCDVVTSNVAQFDRFDVLNSTFVEGLYNISKLRIAKFNRTAYGINFDIEFFFDFNDEYEFSTFFHYNRLNNNQYAKSILRIPKSNFCSWMGSVYPKYLMESFKTRSNLPQYDVKSEKFCPLKKVRNEFILPKKYELKIHF